MNNTTANMPLKDSLKPSPLALLPIGVFLSDLCRFRYYISRLLQYACNYCFFSCSADGIFTDTHTFIF